MDCLNSGSRVPSLPVRRRLGHPDPAEFDGILDLAIYSEIVVQPAATGSGQGGLRQWTVYLLQIQDALLSLWSIHIQDHEPLSREDANIGLGPYSPPGSDLRWIAAGQLLPTAEARMLASVLQGAPGTRTGAGAVRAQMVKRKDAEAQGGVIKRRLED